MSAYSQATSEVRVKAGLADDPDVADPSVSLPENYDSGDPATAMVWRMPGRKSGQVKLKVTFRDDDGVETAGTYKAYGFVVVPLSGTELVLGAERPTIEKHVGVEDGTTAEPLIFEDVGPYDVFGLRLYDITAAGATYVLIRAEEVF